MWKYYHSLVKSLEDVGYIIMYSSCGDKYFSTCLRMRDRVAVILVSFEEKKVTFSINSILKEVRRF